MVQLIDERSDNICEASSPAVEFSKERGVLLERRQEFEEVELFDQLVYRFSLNQPVVGHLKQKKTAKRCPP